MSKVDRFEVDKLTRMDANYPHDNAVPELPPVAPSGEAGEQSNFNDVN